MEQRSSTFNFFWMPEQEFSGADTNLQFSEGNFDIWCCKTAQSASPNIIFSALAEKSDEKFIPNLLSPNLISLQFVSVAVSGEILFCCAACRHSLALDIKNWSPGCSGQTLEHLNKAAEKGAARYVPAFKPLSLFSLSLSICLSINLPITLSLSLSFSRCLFRSVSIYLPLKLTPLMYQCFSFI